MKLTYLINVLKFYGYIGCLPQKIIFRDICNISGSRVRKASDVQSVLLYTVELNKAAYYPSDKVDYC